MGRIAWRFHAACSVLALAMCSAAAVRPHYGGTLRACMREAPVSLDPATGNISQSAPILPLIAEGLTRFDPRGHLQPQLATRWQSDAGLTRWEFWVRAGVKFHDGWPLTADSAAVALRAANPGWTITAAG